MKKKLYLKHVSLGKEISNKKIKIFSENAAAEPNEITSQELTDGIYLDIKDSDNYVNILPQTAKDMQVSDLAFDKVFYEYEDNTGLMTLVISGSVPAINGTYYLNEFININENVIFERYDSNYNLNAVLAWSSIENCWYITSDIDNFSENASSLLAKSSSNPNFYYSISLASWPPGVNIETIFENF